MSNLTKIPYNLSVLQTDHLQITKTYCHKLNILSILLMQSKKLILYISFQ